MDTSTDLQKRLSLLAYQHATLKQEHERLNMQHAALQHAVSEHLQDQKQQQRKKSFIRLKKALKASPATTVEKHDKRLVGMIRASLAVSLKREKSRIDSLPSSSLPNREAVIDEVIATIDHLLCDTQIPE